MTGHPTYRADIEGLRAISILLVVAFHAGLAGFAGGFVGVDVFFVLSGYLITGLLVAECARNQRISLVTFLWPLLVVAAAWIVREFHEIERAIAPDDVEFVDLTATVCESNPCSVVTTDGVIKFSDRHQFTATFSELLAPALVEGLGFARRPQETTVRS